MQNNFKNNKVLMSWHSGITEERVFLEHLSSHQKDSAVIVDVGASYGDYSNLADSILMPEKIYAIEPIPLCCRHLEERFKERPHIEVLNYTLGASSQPATFHELTLIEDNVVMNAMSSIVNRPCFKEERLKVKQRRVDLTPLDFLFDEQIDILKVDAEGYDLQILQGAKNLLSNNLIKYIQFEYGEPLRDAGLTLNDFIDFLKQFNYSVYSLDVDGFTKIDKFVDDFRWVNFFASLHPLP